MISFATKTLHSSVFSARSCSRCLLTSFLVNKKKSLLNCSHDGACSSIVNYPGVITPGGSNEWKSNLNAICRSPCGSAELTGESTSSICAFAETYPRLIGEFSSLAKLATETFINANCLLPLVLLTRSYEPLGFNGHLICISFDQDSLLVC